MAAGIWKRIADQDPSFWPSGEVLLRSECHQVDERHRHHPGRRDSADIQKICKRDPFSGKVVTGGIVTVQDSNWLMSWTLNRQQQFRDQPKDQLCVWVYGVPGQARQLCEEADDRMHR